MYVPAGTTSSLGVVKQHTSTDCTTYTSDDGATTPAAVKQAVQKFIKAGSNVTLTWNDDSSSDAYGYTITSSYTNTKNTAGATNTSSKIYLIGATAQNANPQTYSHDTVYVDTDGLLYSGSKKVSTEGHTHSGSYSKSATATGSTNASGTVANASITPSGTVSKPTFTGTEAGHSHTFKGDSHGHTVTPSTTDVYSITSVGTMFKAEVSGEVLILTAGTAPTRSSSAIKAYTGLTVNGNTQTGTITETKITPAGSVSQPTFTGTAASHNHTFNGSGHTHTITLSDATVTVS